MSGAPIRLPCTSDMIERRHIALGLCLLLLASLAGSLGAAGLSSDKPKLDRSKVLLGNPDKFGRGDRVGILCSQDVYKEIPAYRRIHDEKVKEGSAKWHQLMKKATATFKAALGTVAREGKYKLLIEEGGISGYPTTDVTSDMITAVGG